MLNESMMNEPSIDELPLHCLTAAMATCIGLDPGPDPTWYPDEWPQDPDPEHVDDVRV
ncbi:hypothetical protein [Paraliomyxa miuraensis]|uniref:hypothetical protein n=1 Tax=Paraliomyxa miuraensis TaxID=376150 RepID=UPI00225228B4|nr:hypothetical protein [Paraliomyxa miuraensis]MCX4243973.1 hypothetical protein [Paraliomyxa miuraensis]